MCLGRPANRADQQLIYEAFGKEQITKATTKWGNLPPTGDPLVARKEGDGILRVGNHNIHGSALENQEPLKK